MLTVDTLKSNEKVLRVLLIIFSSVSLLAIILFGLGIKFFPGGHLYNPYTDDFSFYYNPVSDLGRIQAYNGGINNVSRSLYTIALTLLSIFVVIYFVIIRMFFQEKKVTKILSDIGTATAIIQSIFYFLIICSPSDTKFERHNLGIYIGSGFLALAIFIYTAVFFLHEDFSKLNKYSFVAFAVVAIAHATTVTVGSIVGEPLFSISRRAGNTLFIFIVTFIYFLQGLGAYYYLNNKEK